MVSRDGGEVIVPNPLTVKRDFQVLFQDIEKLQAVRHNSLLCKTLSVTCPSIETGRSPGADGQKDIRSVDIRPKQLSLCVCDAARIVMVNCTIQICFL